VITNVVVTYQIKPDSLDEHVRLIEGVFDQLRGDAPSNVEYKVMKLEDGVSFVHVSTADTPDGANPLPALEAFQAFAKELDARITTSPSVANATIIGSYIPAGGLGT